MEKDKKLTYLGGGFMVGVPARDLIGDELGQFNTDFKFPGHSNIHSIRTIVLGKKSYIDHLSGVDKDGKVCTKYHVRMKGVNLAALSEHPDHLALYEKMYSGDSIPFDLTYRGHAHFNFGEDVTTRRKFIRNIKFTGDKVVM